MKVQEALKETGMVIFGVSAVAKLVEDIYGGELFWEDNNFSVPVTLNKILTEEWQPHHPAEDCPCGCSEKCKACEYDNLLNPGALRIGSDTVEADPMVAAVKLILTDRRHHTCKNKSD